MVLSPTDNVCDDDDTSTLDLVDLVVQKDQESRNHLRTLQDFKRRLNVLQQSLRPSQKETKCAIVDNANDDEEDQFRAALLEERAQIQQKIQMINAKWKASCRDTQEALWKLASPVDVVGCEQNGRQEIPDPLEGSGFSVIVPPSHLGSEDTQTAVDLHRAFSHYALQFFGAYPLLHMSRETSLACVSADRAHALWGCRWNLKDSIDSCSICNAEKAGTAAKLPPWVRLLTDFVPPKSIWGDKRLPVYSALWNSLDDDESSPTLPFTLDLVALTASSVVDARQVQSNMVEELKEFYGSLLVGEEEKEVDGVVEQRVSIMRRRVAPSELDCHEWSRIEVCAMVGGTPGHDGSTTLFRLGTVSHWGDAAARACDMAFAGGGNARSKGKKKQNAFNYVKEYVQVVQASVVKTDTWNKILYLVNRHSNCSHSMTLALKRLLADLPDNATVHLSEPNDEQKVQPIFGPLDPTFYRPNGENHQVERHVVAQSSTRRFDGGNGSEPQSEVDEEPFWKEDSWTVEDEESANQILTQSIEKCTVAGLFSASAVSTMSDALAWDLFYQTHQTRFFKDRHYLRKSFPEEFGATGVATKTLVEVGCGVGNAILPLLESENGDAQWSVIHGLDISAEAIRLLKGEPRFLAFNEKKQVGLPRVARAVHGHVCDIAKEPLPAACVNVADVTTLLFCLSAIDPDDMPAAVKTVASSLKPGGSLVFRDYGRYDEAQMKLGTSRSKLLKENYYRKSDGTKCYYFTLEDLERLFATHSGLEVVELKYLRRVYSNKSTGQARRRVWAQGRFRKPLK